MPFSRSPFFTALVFGAVYLLILGACAIYARPVFPVDETRYLTVAWEMFSHHQWILPTLNFEPYHHKPPLLFWLIMGMWHLFGATQAVAMTVPYFLSFAVIALTGLLTRGLTGDDRKAALSMMILMGTLAFAIYANLIMFDILLTACVLIAMNGMVRFAATGALKFWVLIALGIGLGLLAKGPVVLLHVMVPGLLFAWWRPEGSIDRARFYTGLGLAMVAGAVMVLSWAIPAATLGGPEFSDKIFWGQTAGRVVNSFDHQRPFYWYVPIAPLFLAPWIFSPALWRAMRDAIRAPQERIFWRFMISWVAPVFIAFSLISGKQIHYLLPLLPAGVIAVSSVLSRGDGVMRGRDLYGAFALMAFLALLPLTLKILAHPLEALFGDQHIAESFSRHNAFIAAGCFALVGGLGFYAMKRADVVVWSRVGAACMVIIMAGFMLESRTSFFPNYDLTAMAAEIETKYADRPMAFVRNYHGEFGYLAKLERPVKQLQPEELDAWFDANPNGIAFMRDDDFSGIDAKYDVLFSRPFRMTKIYVILAKKK